MGEAGRKTESRNTILGRGVETRVNNTEQGQYSGDGRPVMGENPLDGEDMLLDALYGTGSSAGRDMLSSGGLGRSNLRARSANEVRAEGFGGGKSSVRSDSRGRRASLKPKPSHYKIVSISLYNEDIARLERIVKELKSRGHHKANKSHVIRQALMQLELDLVHREG